MRCARRWGHHPITPIRYQRMSDKDTFYDAPYYPFYVKDWVTETFGLTAEQRGGLIQLRAFAWISRSPCTVPDDDSWLAQRSGLGLRWSESGNDAVLRDFFYSSNGFLYDQSLLRRYDEMVEKAAARTEAGRRGANARWKDRKTASAMRSECQSDSKPDPEQESDTDEQTGTNALTTALNVSADWQQEVQSAWTSIMGGVIDRTKLVPLEPLVDQHGIGEVVRRFSIYLANTEGRFASAKRFAETFGKWAQAPTQYDGRGVPLSLRADDRPVSWERE